MKRNHSGIEVRDFIVENIEEALEGENVLVEPFNPIPTRRVAFIDYEGFLIELAEEVK